MISLSLDHVRTLLLTAQGLMSPPVQKAAKEDNLAAIPQMGLMQLDTLSVLERSQYLVLWGRLGAYETRCLDELLSEGTLFEYWAHAACLLSIEDYPIYRRRMLDYADNGAFIDRQKPEIRQAIEHTLKHIRTNGAARSVDFKNKKRKAGAWWDWSAEKQALEHLFNAGGLMISQRSGFQRVYDLTDRVLPVWDDRDTCSLEEGLRAIVVKAVKALGVAPARPKSR